MSLFRVAVAVTPVFPLSSIHLVPVDRGWGAQSWRSEVVVHALGVTFLVLSCHSIRVQARFRDSKFRGPVGTCSDITTFRWHVPSPFRHG